MMPPRNRRLSKRHKKDNRSAYVLAAGEPKTNVVKSLGRKKPFSGIGQLSCPGRVPIGRLKREERTVSEPVRCTIIKVVSLLFSLYIQQGSGQESARLLTSYEELQNTL